MTEFLIKTLFIFPKGPSFVSANQRPGSNPDNFSDSWLASFYDSWPGDLISEKFLLSSGSRLEKGQLVAGKEKTNYLKRYVYLQRSLSRRKLLDGSANSSNWYGEQPRSTSPKLYSLLLLFLLQNT